MLKLWQRMLNQDQSEGGTPPAETKETPPAETKPAVEIPADDGDGEGRGSKKEVLKDLASERDRRQAAEEKTKKTEEKMVEMAQDKEKKDKALRQHLGLESEEDPVDALKKEADANKALAKNALVISAVTAEGVKQGAVDPDDVVRLINRGALEVDFEKMSVAGVEQAVKDLLEKKPHLVKTKADQPAGAQPPGSDPDGSKLDRDKLLELVKKAKAGDPQAQLEAMKRNKEIQELGIDI